MASDTHGLAHDLSSAIRIETPRSFLYRGRRIDTDGARHAADPPYDGASPLAAALQELMYRVYHCRQAAGAKTDWSPFLVDRAFEQRLSDENRGTGSWEAGWTVVALEPEGDVVVEKDGLRLWTRPTEFSAHAVRVGASGSVRLGKEMRRISPGFYSLAGNENLAPGDPDVLRIYWHVTPDGAPLLVRHVTGLLNDAGMPFRFKVVNHPRHFDRADAGILYMRARDLRPQGEAVVAIHRAVRQHLRPHTSAFTKRLADGLALAEDPGPDISFGQGVSRLFADGLVRAYEKSITSPEQQADEVVAYVRELGFDPSRPYLRPGSRSTFDWLDGVFE